MKALTEFSGTVIRIAAKALADAKSALPQQPAAEATPVAAAPTEGAPPEAAPPEAAPPEAAPPEAAPPEAAPAEAPAPVVAENEGDKAALSAAVSKESGISGDRLERLMEALKVVGSDTADVRLVRVYVGDDAVAGAKKVGSHQYLVDVLPKSMKPTFARPEKERGGRGGQGGQDRPGTGFSMDAVKADRAAKRGPGGGPGAGGPGPRGPKP